MAHSLGSDASLDEPEPRLAIFGPPAITRRMFELWRKDPSLRARFELSNPLRRRDYALWLKEAGEALGLDRQSVAAAVALARRGSSLCRVLPRWPVQSAMPMARCHETVDAWLAEPIAWDLGAPPDGVPMPRALALLWELRQDVHLHFPNRTRAEVLTYLRLVPDARHPRQMRCGRADRARPCRLSRYPGSGSRGAVLCRWPAADSPIADCGTPL